MPDRSKYHGQRLKAKDVLRLYAAGERDFRGAILRGCNVRGANLSGADFSGANICSAQFVDATLHGAQFCRAKGGLQGRWRLFQFCLVMILAVLAGFLQGYAGYVIGFYFTTGGTLELIVLITSAILATFTFFEIARQGFTIKALGNVAVAGFGAVAFAFAVAGGVAVAVAVAFAGIFAVAGVGAFTGTVAGVVGVAFAVAGVVSVAFAVGVDIAFTAALDFAGDVDVGAAIDVGVTVAVTGAAAGFFLSLYINRLIRQKDAKFENLRIIGLAFAALGGTSFSGADLTGATLSYAHLKSINLANSSQRSTVSTHVRWHKAKGLDLARLGTSNLQDPRVLNLLISLNGVDQDLTNADLRGVNLALATLHGIILKGANLSGATLAGAELYGANLTKAQCISTDLTGVKLTGAYLEAWNIAETTILKDIDCEYVFLKEQPDLYGDRERRPHNPDKIFQPGDFEKFFKEMLDTVQILIRNGVDPQAFQAAFEKVMAENPDITRESIQGIEKQGHDVLLTL